MINDDTATNYAVATGPRGRSRSREQLQRMIASHPHIPTPTSPARCGQKCNWCLSNFYDLECRPCVRPAHDQASRHRCERCFVAWYSYRTEDIGDADEDYDFVESTETTDLMNGTSQRLLRLADLSDIQVKTIISAAWPKNSSTIDRQRWILLRLQSNRLPPNVKAALETAAGSTLAVDSANMKRGERELLDMLG